jgi:hypothetical protein
VFYQVLGMCHDEMNGKAGLTPPCMFPHRVRVGMRLSVTDTSVIDNVSSSFSHTLSPCQSLTPPLPAGGCVEIEMWLNEKITWGDYQHNRLDSLQGKVEAYVVSVYLVAMTVTTVCYIECVLYRMCSL